MREITLDFQLGAVHGSQRINQHSSNRAERNYQNSFQSHTFPVTLITATGESGLHIPVNHLTILTGVHLTLNNRISVNQKSLCGFVFVYTLNSQMTSEKRMRKAHNLYQNYGYQC